MRSRQLALDSYDSDKVRIGYLDIYDPVLAPWVDKKIKLLELGIHKGGSLHLWHDYFPRGTIAGIDIKLPKDFMPGERIQVFQGSQADTGFLSEVANKVAPAGFDIIIDDASHIGALTKTTFWHLFENHLKPGGLYAIEDWGTGYWEDFPDGKGFNIANFSVSLIRPLSSEPAGKSMKVPFSCHSYGMVGFVKQLVDEQGAASVTMKYPAAERRASKFESVLITQFIVFVTKVLPTSLTASPNPVPFGNGPGQTRISWNTGNTDIGKVYVSKNGREELLFARKREGSKVAKWIDTGSTYEFRLYNSAHTELLAKVVVNRTTQ
jgi:hypothetical protein